VRAELDDRLGDVLRLPARRGGDFPPAEVLAGGVDVGGLPSRTGRSGGGGDTTVAAAFTFSVDERSARILNFTVCPVRSCAVPSSFVIVSVIDQPPRSSLIRPSPSPSRQLPCRR
jgi:hypothetical protein